MPRITGGTKIDIIRMFGYTALTIIPMYTMYKISGMSDFHDHRFVTGHSDKLTGYDCDMAYGNRFEGTKSTGILTPSPSTWKPHPSAAPPTDTKSAE